MSRWTCECGTVNPTFDPWCSSCESPQPEQPQAASSTQGESTTNSLLNDLRDVLKAMQAAPVDYGTEVIERTILTIRRLARTTPVSSTGAEPVAWLHRVVADDGEPDAALSFSADHFPLEGVAGYRKVSCQPLYTAPPATRAPGVDEIAAAAASFCDAEWHQGRRPTAHQIREHLHALAQPAQQSERGAE